MKLKIGVVLLAAFVIEAANFTAGGAYALDPGNSPATPWYIQLIAKQWGLVHAGGLFALDWLERGGVSRAPGISGSMVSGSPPPVAMIPVSPHPSSHHVLMLPQWGETMVIFLGGYLITALLLTIIMFSLQGLLRWNRRRSAEMA
jgi:hypothetical protein